LEKKLRLRYAKTGKAKANIKSSIIKIPLQEKNATVRLITTTGIVLSSQKVNEINNEITVPTQQGVYFLEILTNNNSRNVVKIIVK